jgi:hypothetical protein
MAKIGENSDYKSGSEKNIFRDIENTPLQERFKIERDGTLGYRVDIKRVGPKQIAGHLTTDNLASTKE